MKSVFLYFPVTSRRQNLNDDIRISSKDVQSRLPTAHSAVGNRPRISLLDTYHPDPWHAPVAATTAFSTPGHGRRKRPKHVE